jgi:hypothetical protein
MVNALGFTPDGQTMLSAGSDNNITSWDLSGHGQPLKLKGHEWGVFSVDVSPDGQEAVLEQVQEHSELVLIEILARVRLPMVNILKHNALPCPGLM